MSPTLFRVLRHGWLNVWRSKWLSAATLAIVTLIFFVFNVVLAARLATDSVIAKVGEKVDLAADFLPDVEPYAAEAFAEALRRRPEVKEVIVITREEALQRFGAKYPSIVAYLEQNQLPNPLPSSVRIVTQRLSFQGAVAAFLTAPENSRLLDQEKLRANEDQQSRNEKVLDISRFIGAAGLSLNLLFALVATLILGSSIGLNIYSRRQELEVMELVGATRSFIRGSFLFQGALMSLAALLLSFFLARFTLKTLAGKLLSVISDEGLLSGLNAVLLHYDDRMLLTLLWQVVFALALGLLAALFSVHVYFRRRPLF